MTFVKLFASITESTIWCEDDQTRIVWITMLAMADRKGIIAASVPGLANRARVPLEAVRRALQKFLAPDPDSSSSEFEGRRIEVLNGGWRLLNYERYREIRDEDDRREYMRDYMRNRRSSVNSSVNNVSSVNSSKLPLAYAEADAEAEKEKTLVPSDDPIPKIFAFFVETAGKSPQYRLTPKRYAMATKRWEEEVRSEKARGTPLQNIRNIVGTRIKHVIEEICASRFHREKGYLEWDQIFSSEDRFTKWVDRYQSNYSENNNRPKQEQRA